MTLDPDLAAEAKSLVALAFRNGPIEALHTGKPCPVGSGKAEVSHLYDDEMKAVMKAAVDTLYRLLWQRDYDPAAYQGSARVRAAQHVAMERSGPPEAVKEGIAYDMT